MGRKRLTADHHSGMRVIDRQKRQAEEQLCVTTRDCIDPNDPPEELRDQTARKEWRRVLPALSGIDMLGDCDRANLIGYCNAWSKYVEAVKTDDSVKIRTFGEEVRKFEACCYLTPDSRLKAAHSKMQSKEQQIEELFGII